MSEMGTQFVVAQQYQQETFQDSLKEMFKSAPWLLVSILCHLVVGVVVANMDWLTIREDEQKGFFTEYVLDEFETPLIEDIREDKDIEDVDQKPEEPDVVEYVDNADTDFLEDDPIQDNFEKSVLNNIIGVGKGSIGKRGLGFSRGRGKRNSATQKQVDAGLLWLHKHQSPEGHWDCDGFDMFCPGNQCSGKGGALNDVGVTGLALLAFLGAGNTPFNGEYRKTVKKGVRYLCDMQDPEDGCLVTKENERYMYNHAIGCLALCEAYGLSKWVMMKKYAQKALDFIHTSKNHGKAWRYNLGNELDPIEQNDVSVTGWMIMCLSSAKDFGLNYHPMDAEDALMYIDEMTNTSTGRTGYKERGSASARESGAETVWPSEHGEAMTGVGMFSRVLCAHILGNEEEDDEMLEKGAALLRHKPPRWDEEKGFVDYYYWYYGTYAMFQLGGPDWKVWKTHMVDALAENQCMDKSCAMGSWPPQAGPWGNSGGRVYSTALSVLCLEVFYRYDKIFGARR